MKTGKDKRDGRRVLYRLSSTKVASWLVDGIPLIVPDDSDSALLKTAVQRAMTLWSEDEILENDSARLV